MSKALVCGFVGRAVIIDEDGKTYGFDLRKPHDSQNPGLPAPDVHVGFFLQPKLMEDYIEEREAGSYPFPDILAYLKVDYRRRTALNCVVNSFRDDTRMDLKIEFAGIAEKELQDPEVYEWVLNRCLEVPLPEEADIENAPKEGKVGQIIKETAEKWRGR
jgi:hypothetical protein